MYIPEKRQQQRSLFYTWCRTSGAISLAYDNDDYRRPAAELGQDSSLRSPPRVQKRLTYA
jgi:hypothetical protein